jgi:hypothetical protein
VLRYAAIFFLGLFSGVVSVKQFDHVPPAQPQTVSTPSFEQSDPSGNNAAVSPPSIGAISPRQAEELFLASEQQLQKKSEHAILAATGLNPEEIRARIQESSYAGSEYLLRRFRQHLDETQRRTEL